MGIKRHRPEEIVTKLRQVAVLVGQGMSRIDAIREVQITEQTFYRWRKQYGGMGTVQLRELNRHFLDSLQIHGDHTQIAPPFNWPSVRSRQIT